LYILLSVSIPIALLNSDFFCISALAFSAFFLACAAGDISSLSKASNAVSVSAATCTFTSPSLVVCPISTVGAVI
tara:strand:+ start:79 stop:303 length:225 start_codon:yes stop_codon:yes gene_type:complete